VPPWRFCEKPRAVTAKKKATELGKVALFYVGFYVVQISKAAVSF
jgi:hypothetical protein